MRGLMSTEPTQFLRETFPKLFAKGVAVLEAKAGDGDAQAQRILEDVKGVTGAGSMQIGDGAPVVFSAKDGMLSAGDGPEAGVPIKLAVALPGDAVGLLLGEVVQSGALDNDEVAVGAAQTVSKRLVEAIGDQPMTCHVSVTGVPDLGDVKVRVGMNVPEPPTEPGFTAQIAYADLEAVRAGQTTVQELFMAGKLRMEGDYTAAIQIAMQLLTNPL
jgi:hypothetical protein